MKRFAELYAALDATTKTNEKVAAIRAYFEVAPPEDAAWAVYFLSGKRPKRLVRSRDLRAWATEAAGIPDWLFAESYSAVGDFAETVALLLPAEGQGDSPALHRMMSERILPLRNMLEDQQKTALMVLWASLGRTERFVFNKLITGGFRVGVSRKLMVRGLAEASGIPAEVLLHRLMGHWEPTAEFFNRLVDHNTDDASVSRPYPFCLAHALEKPVEELGAVTVWQAEWKWDGIRAQVVVRGGQVYIWSRGGELITDAYPEVVEAAFRLPEGTVLDGELLAWNNGVLPFDQMQRRIGRKKVGPKLRKEVPVVLLAYDLLEADGEDLRAVALSDRRARLEALLGVWPDPHLSTSDVVRGQDWSDLAAFRAESRDRGVEGLMLKRLDGPYAAGRPTGLWWKWKIAPRTVDAVLIYAQPGHGKRSGLYTDYTFAVRDGDALVPFAKAYSGLSNEEIREVDRFVRRNTVERFGPVRSVKPELVFEIAFEGIWRSKRHKSGIAVRFPRMARWRRDLGPADADSLADLESMLGNAHA
ncbi:MAG: ATP-dependent DNA ligase [Rhodothermales bacterium]|nr:ATP-dependent DNA ligase [Rhodothermales bacterium]MBO6780042.1 ATP-dependent DNA ligase [Rhodothermales bacterium]